MKGGGGGIHGLKTSYKKCPGAEEVTRQGVTFPRNLHVNALNQVTSFLHTKPYRQYNVMFALQVNTSLPH